MNATNYAPVFTRSICRLSALGAILLFLLCPMSSAVADDSNSSYGIQSQDPIPQRSRLDFEVGYFTARRGDFREVYKGGITAGASYERRINHKFGWGVRSSFRHQSETLIYWHIALSPYATYTLAESRSARVLLGGGMGAGYRHVGMQLIRTDSYGTPLFDMGKVWQRSFGVFTMAMAGFDLRLSEKFCFGGRAYFDYYFSDQLFGDVKRGDFGDTGGFSFTGRIGFAL